MNKDASLYFHSPCFDGIVSCVLALDFLEASEGWKIQRFNPVDYTSRTSWLDCQLSVPCAVVDFLYHPKASFWADHHPTTFVSPGAKRHFEHRSDRRLLCFNNRLSSCALLLSQFLAGSFGFRNPRYAEMVEWADKIDSARYASVEEAILGETPALRIRASMGAKKGRDYFERLVKTLRDSSLEEVARQPEVSLAADEVQSSIRAGLERFERAATIDDDGIVVFDVDGQQVMINRYTSYYFFPQARYSVGIVRSETGAKITAMRDPWYDFSSVPLGKIFEKFGGGGHQRVGALLLPGNDAGDAKLVLQRIVDEIRAEDAVVASGGPTI